MQASERKDKAQQFLLHGMAVGFDMVDNEMPPSRQRDEIKREMDRQMKRVEKLFGWQPGSWGRGA